MRFLPLLILLLLLTAMPGRAHANGTEYLAPAAVENFYQQHNGALAWADEKDFQDLMTALSGLSKHGLVPQHYHLAELSKQSRNIKKRDKLATDAWFSAAAHMIYGKLDPQTVEPNWTAATREADLQALLEVALHQHGVEYSLDLLAPRQPGYWALVGALAKARSQVYLPQTTVPPGQWLKPGMTDARVATVQKRLVELGLLEEAQQTGVMDEDTDKALRTFQTHSGLEPDGVVGPKTLHALNRSPQEKIDQIRVNLERWRWLPDDLGKRHIRANIADFTLKAWQDNAPVGTYPIIVGMPYRKTPVFSDMIEYVVFNPWWETPRKLAVQDKLPLFQSDPEAVTRMGFKVLDIDGKDVDPATIDWNTLSRDYFPYRLRQSPGEMNALGRVKIMFPNSHDVYIHDTPRKDLFDEHQRAFSSGCIRTKNVLRLTQWLLDDEEKWNDVTIAQIIDSQKETRVSLKSRVPVYILYMTAIVENYGAVRFLDDIYGRDYAVLKGLNAYPG